MSHNPPFATDAFFPLENAQTMTLKGADAVRFAHAQFMNDASALGWGQWQWSGWLNPKGRVIALFALLKISDEELWLLLPSGGAQAFLQQLRGYVFRSKVQLACEPELRAFGSFSEPAHATGNALHSNNENGWEMDFSGVSQSRCLLISRHAPALIADHASLQTQWTACDLAHGLPHLRDQQLQAWTPQQLSLERLRAYSVKKGCYPGQEIVARTHFLGQAKRGLLRLRIPAASVSIAPETILRCGEETVGTIICSAGEEALAVTNMPPPTGELFANAQPVMAMPLLGGLER